MQSHLFLYYFILSDLYFIPILPDRENRAPILIVFYFYFKPIWSKIEQGGVFYFYFLKTSGKISSKTDYFNPLFISYISKIVIE